MTGNPGPVRQSIEDQKLLDLGVSKRNIILECGHPEPVKQAVLQKLGCAFLFESTITAELLDGRLLQVAVSGGLDFSSPIYLIVRNRKALSSMERVLISFVRDQAAR